MRGAKDDPPKFPNDLSPKFSSVLVTMYDIFITDFVFPFFFVFSLAFGVERGAGRVYFFRVCHTQISREEEEQW